MKNLNELLFIYSLQKTLLEIALDLQDDDLYTKEEAVKRLVMLAESLDNNKPNWKQQ